MNKKYCLIVFDWEGTLGDTVGETLYRFASETGVDISGAEAANEDSFRLNLVQAIRRFFPHWSAQQVEQFCSRRTPGEGAEPAEICLLPGAKKFITQLNQAGVNLAIASNRGQQSLHGALQRSALLPFFRVTRSAGQLPPKPCPEMLEEILDEFSLNSDEALMIGDSVTDIEMAKSIGMDAVGVDFYHQNTDALHAAGALAVFDNYPDLAQFLKLSN